MRRRHGMAAVVATVCVVAGLLNGGVSADADDAVTIEVDAGAVAAGADGKCSLVEAITNVSGHNRVWTDCPSGAGITRLHLPAATYSLTAALPQINQSVEIAGDGADSTFIDGGGLYPLLKAVGGGWLTVDGLTLRNGKSGQGGAIAAVNEAGTMTLTVRNSSFEHNTTSSGEGGAIYLDGGTLTVTGSSFIGNASKRDGGAIGLGPNFNFVSATVANSTFVNNTAASGGVFAVHTAGHSDAVDVVNSTFSGNDATTKNTGLSSTIETVTLKNSIVAKGAAKQPVCATGETAYGPASTHNLTDDVSCSARFFTVVSAIDLGAIGLHGGTTANFEPPAGSPAVDAGDDAACGAAPVGGEDQRGFTRSGQGAHCDIGAIEVQVEAEPVHGAVVTASKAVSGDFAPGGEVTYTVILRNGGAGVQGDNAGHEFFDALPAGLALESAESSTGTVVGDIDVGRVTWDGQVATGATVTITIVASVTGTIGNTISNQGSVSYDSDGDGANDTTGSSDDPSTEADGDATTFVVMAPSVHTTKRVTTVGPYHPGSAIGYSVVVSNDGNVTATGVTLTDELDANTTLDIGSIDSATGVVSAATDSHVLVAELGAIAAGGTVEMTFDAVATASVPAGTATLQNQAVVSGTNFDEVLSDDDDDPSNGLNPTVSVLETSPGLDVEIGGSQTTAPGEVMTYSLAWSNTGDIGLDDVVIAAGMPIGSHFEALHSTSGWVCGTAGVEPACELSLGALNGGAAGTVWFAVTVDEDVAADLLSLGVRISSGDVAAEATASTAILRPSISASMTGPESANPSGVVQYAVTVTNSGGFVARDVVVESTLPSGLTFTAGGGCTATGQVVTCAAGDIEADGGAASVKIDAKVAQYLADRSTLSVGATVTWPLEATAVRTNSVTTTIEGIDLTAFVEGIPILVPGETIVVQVIYANLGSATATGVWIEASLPPGTSMEPELSPGWACNDRDCYLPLGTLAAGNGVSPIGITLDDVGDDVKTVGIGLQIGDDGGHGPDADIKDNATLVPISIVRPDLSMTLSGPTTASRGDGFAYLATVANVGEAAASASTLTDVLPTGVSFNAAASSAGCVEEAAVVSCAVPALAIGDSASVSIAVTANGALLDGTSITNRVDVGTVVGEAVSANNSSVAASTIIRAADLQVTASGGGSARPGEGVGYRFDVSNEGSLPAADAVLTVELADGLAFAAADSSVWCDSVGQVVTCVIPDGIGPAGSVRVEIGAVVAEAPADGAALVSIATAASATGESAATLGDNTADVVTTVAYLLGVDAAITAPGAATTDDTFTYVVTITNTGDAAAIEFIIAAGEGVALDSVSTTEGVTCPAVTTYTYACSGSAAVGSTIEVRATGHLDGSILGAPVSFDVTGRAFTGSSSAPIHERSFSAAAVITATRTVAVELVAEVSPRVALPAGEVTYIVTATNHGDMLETATLTVALPDGLEFQRATSNGGLRCAGDVVLVCSWDGFKWPKGAIAHVYVVARVEDDAAPGVGLPLVATLSHADGETSVTTSATVAPPPPDVVVPGPPPPVAGGGTTYTYSLSFRWTLITWVGTHGISPGEALGAAGDELAGAVNAIYAWDAEIGGWLGYFGEDAPVPGANDLEAMEFGQVYWVAIEGASEAAWTVPFGGLGE